MLDAADFGRNPHGAEFGEFGLCRVRFGKAKKRSPPRRRSVLTVFDWTPDILNEWFTEVRPLFGIDGNPAAWPSERGGTETAAIDWEAVISALDADRLPSSGGNGGYSGSLPALAYDIPVSLGEAIAGIDARKSASERLPCSRGLPDAYRIDRPDARWPPSPLPWSAVARGARNAHGRLRGDTRDARGRLRGGITHDPYARSHGGITQDAHADREKSSSWG